MGGKNVDSVVECQIYREYLIEVVCNQSQIDGEGKWIVTWGIYDPNSGNKELLMYRPVKLDVELVSDLKTGISARFAEAVAMIDAGKLPMLK